MGKCTCQQHARPGQMQIIAHVAALDAALYVVYAAPCSHQGDAGLKRGNVDGMSSVIVGVSL